MWTSYLVSLTSLSLCQSYFSVSVTSSRFQHHHHHHLLLLDPSINPSIIGNGGRELVVQHHWKVQDEACVPWGFWDMFIWPILHHLSFLQCIHVPQLFIYPVSYKVVCIIFVVSQATFESLEKVKTSYSPSCPPSIFMFLLTLKEGSTLVLNTSLPLG